MAMEAKGDQLMHEAEQALKKWSLFGGTDKYEDAAEKYQRAGHAFKAGKAWMSAAKAYENAAKNFQKAKSEGDVANCFIEAARAYVKGGDAKTATEVLETEALPRMVDAGRLSQAAKLHQEVAEMMEEEGQFDGAMDNYQKSADLFNAENASSTASKCMEKIGKLAAQLEPTPDFERAATVFAQVGSECMASNLMKFSAKSHFFNSVICTLARGDIVAAEADLNKFKEQDYTFGGSRECKLLEDVCTAFKDGSMDGFTDAVFNYDQISKLDPWRTSILLRIKNQIEKASGEGNDLT